MKNYIFRLSVRVFYVLLVCVGQAKAQQGLSIDEFNDPPIKGYLGYAPKPVYVQEGYGVYYESAGVKLHRIKVIPSDNTNKALQVQYDLPPYFSWGNWLSIRREFRLPLDLSKYQGLEMNLKVEIPSNASLRITLSDIEDNGKHKDEMWWFDFDSSLLKNRNQRWFTLRVPFEDFYLSWGAGTRHNNRRMNLSKIVAFEINLVSKPQEHSNGAISVDFLRVYK